MSRQLARIRSLISEIDGIQKQGQSRGLQVAAPAQAPDPAISSVLPVAPVEEKLIQAPEAPPPVAVQPVPQIGRIAIQLTGNVIVQMQIDEADETVEIRHVLNSSQDMIEIRFSDGKAVQLPLRTVS